MDIAKLKASKGWLKCRACTTACQHSAEQEDNSLWWRRRRWRWWWW